MSQSQSISELDDEQWNRLQEIVERFESACADRYPQDIASYLSGLKDPLRGQVLQEIIRTDLEIGWRKRQGMRIEHYEKRFPELLKLDCRVELLQDEYRLRQNFGDRPPLTEYKSRFPEEYERFARRADDLIEQGEPESSVQSALTLGASLTKNFSPNDSLETSFALTGRFKKIRKIGSGGFGEVWEAQAPGGVPVAVKRVHGTVSAKSVERERKSLDLICSGQLRHPFLLQVFSWWIHGDRLHIMMELADGSLDERLKEVKEKGLVGIPKDELRQVMIDAASALDFLNHDRNILHRDVKPANMLLMSQRLKLCDFGLSKMTLNLALETGKTMGAGTPVFIAPEIIEGYQSMNSDQYSLAASYHMLRTGRPVFRGKVREIRRQHLEDQPALDDEILTDAEKNALRRALSKSPESRFPTSMAFVEALFADFDPSATANAVAVAKPADSLSDGDDEALTLMDLKVSATPKISEPMSPQQPSSALTDDESVMEVPLINMLAGPTPPGTPDPATLSRQTEQAKDANKRVRPTPSPSVLPSTPSSKSPVAVSSGNEGRNWQHLRRATPKARGATRPVELTPASGTRRQTATSSTSGKLLPILVFALIAALLAILLGAIFGT